MYLAIADADKIHDYVFSPHELKLIRGGSRLQNILNRRVLPQLARESGGEVIFAGGGTVLARFADEENARRFCQAAGPAFRRRTATATVSTAFKDSCGDFPKSLVGLQDLLERRKQAVSGLHFNAANPFGISCEACGRHPATFKTLDKLVCHACRLRDDAGRRHPFAAGRLAPARDFEDIAEASRPENYLGLVYIDLDRLGRFLGDHIRTETDYRTISKAVDNAVTESVRRCSASLPAGRQGRASFEILLMGGDDAIVALPADRALPFVLDFDRCYAEALMPTSGRPTFSAGVVIAHHHFPIAEFMALAEDLLRSAKREKGEARTNTVDYLILSESMAERLQEVRQRMNAGGVARTGKPYTLEGLQRLLDDAKSLGKSVPASRLRQLYPLAFQGREQGSLRYLDLVWRSEEKARAVLLNAIGPDLWSNSGGKTLTRVCDLVELQEFLPKGGTNEAAN
jgi:hypothetical protein